MTFDFGFNVLVAYNKFVILKLLWIARNYFSLLNIQPQSIAGVIFLNLFLLTDWFQYRPQRRYHFEWDASSRTWQVCRGSYWNKWPSSEGVLSWEGVYGILVQADFCFTTADATWLHYDWLILSKVRFSYFNAPWGKSLFRLQQVRHPLPHSMLSVRSRNPCNYGSGFKG